MKHLLAFCESRRLDMLRAVETLVRLESPSLDKAAVDRCAAEASSRLRDLGGRVRTIACEQAGNCVQAEFGENGRRVLILGHLDTVWSVGHLERMPIRLEAGRLHGPGVFDMKAGVVIACEAVRALAQAAPDRLPHVTVLFTGDEETGSAASRSLIETEAARSDAVLVLEPALPGGALKTSRKGCGEFELTVRGVAAHAGIEPEKGASAILELAEQILAVERLQNPAKGTTVSIGVVSGGTRPNVVADQARALIDARAVTSVEAERLDAALRALTPRRPRTSLEWSGGFDRPPFERTVGVARLFALAQAVAAELGFDLDEGATGGGSDGNFTAALGVPTIDGLGAEGDGAHAAHEHILVDRLAPRAALVAGLIARIGGREG
jgi:glutamate carboxypeptidase